MSKEKLVPKLRFKEFKNAKEWENKLLGEIVSFYSGLTYSPNDIVDEKDTLVLRSSNVKNGEIVQADNVYVDSKKVNSDNVQVGDIIVVVRNGSRHLIGKNAQIKQSMEKTVIGAFMTGIRSDIPKFIKALLDTNEFQVEIYKDLGATINQITTGNFKKMRFKFPKEDESKKIGSYFEKLDSMILAQQKKTNKLEDIKSAYLSEMFPKEGEKYPKKRFEGFTEPWEKSKFNGITEYATSSLSANNVLAKGKYELYDANELIGYTNSSGQEQEYITIIKDGSGVGRVRLLPKKSNFIGTMGAIISKEQVDVHYIHAYLQRFNFTEFITGATVPHVYYRDYGESIDYHPPYDEQVRIGKLFKNLDNQISIEEEKLEKLEKLKQAYLNDMFV